MRGALILMLTPALASAEVTYQLSVQSFLQPAGAPVVSSFAVQGETIRVDIPSAHLVDIFKAGTLYVVDSTSRSVQAMTGDTLDQIAKNLSQSVEHLEAVAADAPSDQRDAAKQLAAMAGQMQEHRRSPARTYQSTDRLQTVDGRSCRIWEEFEDGAKRLEVCVAPTSTIPQGAQVLLGMKALSQYWHGSVLAFGVEFGPTPSWPDIEALKGVPILIREFKDSSVVSQTTVSSFERGTHSAKYWNVPDGYTMQERHVNAD